jgi:hypothetical protein
VPARRQPRRAGDPLELFDAAPDAARAAAREPIAVQPAVSEPESEFVNFGEYPGESMRSAISVSTLTQTAKDVI